MYLKSNEVFRQMNKLGRSRTPFFFMLDFEAEKGFICGADEAEKYDVFYQFQDKNNTKEKVQNNKSVNLEKFPQPYSEYKKSFEVVRQNLVAGNSYLVNLTCQTPIHLNVSLKEIFSQSKAKYKLLFQNDIVVFSPEIFVRIENGFIRSFPMKGTIDASVPNAKNLILTDYKETAEHNTIVDLIRNDLSMVARNVRVERYRYVDEIRTSHKNLLQVSSEIVGELPEDYLAHLGDIFQKLLPAGSISGAPKKKTVEIIRSAETYSRGFYTGIMGLFDGVSVDSGVMIRFIHQENGQLFFCSGGGITIHSDCQKEYQEMIDKVYVPIV